MQAHREVPSAYGLWEGASYSLDGWADVARWRPPANYYDMGTCAPGPDCNDPIWGCHNNSPFDHDNRTWEMIGGQKSGNDENNNGNYLAATVLYNGWAGGFGAYDCEPLARLFGPAGETYGAYAQYSVGSGWEY